MVKKLMKLTMALAAVALLMTQCRKPEPNLPVVPEGTEQYITFTANNGNAKVDITNDPLTALQFKWETGIDKIQVYGCPPDGTFEANGSHCGEIICTAVSGDRLSATFGGKVTMPAEGGKIRFYYFASGFNSTDKTAIVDLSTQNGQISGDGSLKHKVVAYSPDYNVTASGTYGGTITVPYAVAKLDMTNFKESSGNVNMVIMGNPANCVSVNANGIMSFIATTGTNGTVTLTSTTTVCNVAFAPVTDGNITFYGNGSFYNVTKSFVPNKYYTAEDPGTHQPTGSAASVPTQDFTPGKFSVAAGRQVQFSRGNLQYLGKGTDSDHSTTVWRFAEHQYDIMGASYGNGTLGGSNNYGNVNFGTYYTTYNNNNGTIGTTTGTTYAMDVFLHDEDGYTNTFTGWRRLAYNSNSDKEWRYLINREYKKESGKTIPRYGVGCVHGVLGMILLPDDMNNVEELVPTWKFGPYVEWSVGTVNPSGDKNVYSDTDWLKLESAGAVFLPCAGWRYATNSLNEVNSTCHFYHSNNGTFYDFKFSSSTVTPETSVAKSNYFSIRLVKDVPSSK